MANQEFFKEGLLLKLDEAGLLNQGVLDEEVTDMLVKAAADANIEGDEFQLETLLSLYNEQTVNNIVQDLIDDKGDSNGK